jgi:hypothetical protein
MLFAAMRSAFGDRVSNLAAADTPALLVNNPLAVFMIDCSLDFDALKVPVIPRLGEPSGVVEGNCGFETEIVFAGLAGGAMAAFSGETKVAVDADLTCPKPDISFPGPGDIRTGVLILSS